MFDDKIKLSILIMTIPNRTVLYKRLLDILVPQLPSDNSVEIITRLMLSKAEGGNSVGKNRQKILEMAGGEYVCCIDDDDIVSNDYLASIMFALRQLPDAVGFYGHYIRGRDEPVKVIMSMNNQWRFANGIFERPIQPLNPTRRELALKAGYEDEIEDDRGYAMRLKSLLKKEVFIEKVLYYHLKSDV